MGICVVKCISKIGRSFITKKSDAFYFLLANIWRPTTIKNYGLSFMNIE